MRRIKFRRSNINQKIYESIDSKEIENQLKAVEKVLPNVIISSYKLPFTIKFDSLPNGYSLYIEFEKDPFEDSIRYNAVGMVPREYSNGLCDDVDLYSTIIEIYNVFAGMAGVVDKVDLLRYSEVNENKRRNKKVNESMSVSDYENKIKNLSNSAELDNILMDYDLPTDEGDFSDLIRQWFDYQYYIDDPQGYDAALAYYYSIYGDNSVFQTAIKDAIQNMKDNGFADVNESKNKRNKYKTRKTFENFRKMKRNKKVTYRVNESSQRKRFKRLPMFENYLEEKYDSVKLLDGHKYTLTDDVVAESGQVLAKKGDTVTYEDVVGVFTNNATEFTTDCGVFRTEDGQALQPEILMSQNLLSDPQSKMTEDPKAFMTEVVAECRKVGKKLGKAAATRKKIYESLTDEQKKKYQAKKEKLSSEQIEKYNKEIDDMEAKAQKLYQDMEDGKITQEEMMKKTDRLTKSALEKYRTVTGGEDPAWYEDYMDEPGFGKANEDEFYYVVASENADELDEMAQFCADNGYELPKDKIIDGTIDVEFARNEAGNYVDFRICDPKSEVIASYKNADGWTDWLLDKHQPVNEDSNWKSYINGDSERVKTFDEQFAPYRQTLDNFYEKYKGTKTCDAVIAKINEYINDPSADDIKVLVDELREIIMSAEDLTDLEADCIFESEEATETEVKDVVNDDILTPETIEAVLTADDDVEDETVAAVVDAVKDDAKEGEEISLDDVVDATVDAELSKEEATAVIDAVVDAVVDQKVEDETVNESKKYSLKKAVKESLRKKFRKGVFEARVRRIRNKKK